jgi:hypothetical protein
MLFILFSFVTYLCVLCIKTETINVELSVYDGESYNNKTASYNVTLLNSDKYTDDPIRIDIEGQLCFFSSFVVEISHIPLLLSLCPSDMILLIDNALIAKTLQALQLSRLTTQRLDYKAIIFKTDKQALKLFYQDLQKPFLLLDDTYFEELLTLSNQFVKIKYNNLENLMEYEYLYIATVVVLSVSFIVLIWWNIYGLIVLRNKITLLQRILVLLPYFKFTMSCLIIYYIQTISEKNLNNTAKRYEDPMDKIYYDTLISTVAAIYKTLYWFSLILIANGWHIFTNSLQNLKLSNYVCIYMTIYLVICFDQILDLTEVNHIDGLYVSQH